MNKADLIAAARGERPVDRLFANARLVNVFSGEIETCDIAVFEGFVAGFGAYPARERVDLAGRFVLPGFIDAHVHIESAMTSVSEFVRAVLPTGTTTVIADPHEIANVLGAEGISCMIREGARQPMNIFFTAPSCVPATPMETAGAVLDAAALSPFLDDVRVPALAEMMNFPGVIHGEREVLEKIALAEQASKPVDGHCPGLSGKALCAYIAAGIQSDHECVALAEAREKLAAGMHIMIREGSGAKNLDALLPLVTERTAHRVMWCTDDRHPQDILMEGHVDAMVRRAVSSGLDPVFAVQIATLNPARYFGLHRIGAVAPGMQADFIVASDLGRITAEQVWSGGRLAAENGQMHPEVEIPEAGPVPSAMHVDAAALDFRLPAEGDRARAIEVVPGQVITRQAIRPVKKRDGLACADPKADLLKIAVVERHRGTGRIGMGFIHGFGLQQGAIASSVAHDSHNIVVVGAEDTQMRAAVAHVAEMGGGLCVVSGDAVKADLPLPIAGLMSNRPLHSVQERLHRLLEAARQLGCTLEDPFMTLSFMALPVIPELKITDRGIFDGNRFAHVPLFCD
jgi:adenine deaminase